MTVMKGTYKNGQIIVFFSINSYCNCDFFCIFAEKLETMEAKHDVEKTTESRPSTVKPAKSSAYLDMISPQVLNDLQKKIVAIVVNQKKYLDKNYSVKQLSLDMGTNTRYVSATINICFNMNYTSFINKYRIEDAMTILRDKKYQDLRIEEVSDMVGFSNRQSFYTSFFKLTGVTPKAYKRSHMVSDTKTKRKNK